MAVTRVARRSVADQLFEQLLDRILAGELAGGSQLPADRDLAVQAGVNRQAVREALQRLRQMDLVEIVHGGGVRVNDWRVTGGLGLLPMLLVRPGRAIDPVVARSIMELWATLGADAARCCAERSPAGTSITLRAIVEEMDLIGADPQRWASIGFEFWEAVVTGADNVAYRLAFNTLRVIAPHLPGVLGIEWARRDGFRAVTEAIAGGDGAVAEDAARRLLEVGVTPE